MTYADCKTKKARVEFIREMISTNDKWMLKALIAVFNKQTEAEKSSEATQEHNGVGFTGTDGTILASFAKQFIRKGGLAMLAIEGAVDATTFFSPKQLPILRKKMPKYARQLEGFSK